MVFSTRHWLILVSLLYYIGSFKKRAAAAHSIRPPSQQLPQMYNYTAAPDEDISAAYEDSQCNCSVTADRTKVWFRLSKSYWHVSNNSCPKIKVLADQCVLTDNGRDVNCYIVCPSNKDVINCTVSYDGKIKQFWKKDSLAVSHCLDGQKRIGSVEDKHKPVTTKASKCLVSDVKKLHHKRSRLKSRDFSSAGWRLILEQLFCFHLVLYTKLTTLWSGRWLEGCLELVK